MLILALEELLVTILYFQPLLLLEAAAVVLVILAIHLKIMEVAEVLEEVLVEIQALEQ
jgi:hypothetical protein